MTLSSLSLLAVRGYVTWTILLPELRNSSSHLAWARSNFSLTPPMLIPVLSIESADMSLRGGGGGPISESPGLWESILE